MAWLLPLLQLLIPEIIKLLIAIFTKSKELPTEERTAVRSEAKSLAMAYPKSRDRGPLKRLHDRIVARIAELKS